MPMRSKLGSYACTAALLLILTACAQPAPPSAESSPLATTHSTAPSAPPSSNTPAPSPRSMTKKEAGRYFLGAICPLNKSRLALYAKVDPSWSERQQGYVHSKLDLKATKSAAAKQRDATRKTINRLTDEKVHWPTKAAQPVAAFAEELYADISHSQDLAISSSKAGFFAEWTSAPDLSKAGALSQKVRTLLDLPADVEKSCGT